MRSRRPVRFSRDRRTLTLKKLALRVARQRDREAALVLGDAMMEQGLSKIQTGRVRPVRFVVPSINPEVLRALAADLVRRRAESSWSPPITLYQPGYETLYNVDRFVRLQTEQAWQEIFSMWVTPKRGTYQALVRAGVLPRAFKFREIIWEPLPRGELAYRLYLERKTTRRLLPKGRKRVLRVFLLLIERRDEPATEEQYFREPKQRALFEDE